jgi:Smg protein
MKERVVEILVFLMTELRDDKQLHDIDLAPLRDRGYTTSEISAAFSWLYETMGAGEAESTSLARAARGSRRILHEVERSVLSLDAQGYIIQLAELGLLDDRDMETVIERAIGTGYAGLSVQEVKEIVAAVLSSRERPGSTGGHSMLNNEDTIH